MKTFVSYPKSGRTWVRFALATSNVELIFTHAGAATNRRQIGRRYDRIPDEMLNRASVFMYRNPIDTAVSMFYQVNYKDLRPWSSRWLRVAPRLLLGTGLPPAMIDDFVLHPVWGIEKICRYNRLWLDHVADRSDCLVLTYEEMRADPGEGFQKLLDHLGNDTVSGAALAEASDFARMRDIEKNGIQKDSDAPGIVGTSSDGKRSAKVRRGKVKGYTDELRPETVTRCREIAARYGFSA